MKNIIVGILTTALSVVSAAYNPTAGLKGVYYSAASYCSAASVQSWSCGEPCSQEAGVTSITPIRNDAKGTFGYVAYNKNANEIVVSFRGSQNIQNWITNIDFGKMNYKDVAGAQVHTGFY